ncbi:MAG TPA: FAD-dependent oxidoreductase, partial [Geminicoccaceae bacterium]|nr:FAD-dependent oxidoreductase [Geminicoccaceae bacterium]
MPRSYTPPVFPYQPSEDQRAARAVRRPVVVVGAGPVGLTLAVDLATRGVGTVVLEARDTVSGGSRSICHAKRSLEILDRLGVGERFAAKGVTWKLG